MKQTLAILLLVSFVTLAPAKENPTRTVEVTGSGRVSVAPDICYMRFGVETSSPQSASAAYRNNCATMNAIVDALKAAGVPPKDIQTAGLYMRPLYDGDPKTGKRSLSAHSVQQSVNVKIRDLTSVSAILDAAVAAGANNVGEVNFTVEDAGKYTEAARTDAMKDAKSKAEKIAGDAGARLGRPLTIELSGADYGYRGGTFWADALQAGVAGSELQVGETELRQTVTVKYELE